MRKFIALMAVSIAASAAHAAAPAGSDKAAGVNLPAFETVTLDNGAQLLLLEKHDVPLVAMTAVLRGGAIADAPGKEGTAALLAELLRKGAGGRSAAQFAEAVESVGGQLDTAAGRESLQVSAEFMARDLDLMLELVADLMQRPKLDANEFEKLRQRAIDSIAAAKDGDPNPLLGVYGHAWLFRDHPYGRPTEGDETSLATIQAADVAGYYRAQLGGDRLVLAIAGDFSTRDLKKKLTKGFGAWGKAGGTLPVATAMPRIEGRRVLLVDKPGATQTYFWLGNVGTKRTDPERVAQGLVNSAYGGRFTSILNSELRIKSGLTYGARSTIERLSQPGILAISSFTATETSVKAIDLALETLARLHAQGLDATALESTKKYVLGSFPPELETSRQLAARLAELAFHGLGRDDVDQYAARVQAATLPDTRRAIDTLYPVPGNLAMVFIGDAAKVRGDLKKYGALTEMSMGEKRFLPSAAR